MHHLMIVGKPETKKDEVVGYTDARQIASVEVFAYRQKGYVVIPQSYIDQRNEKKALAAAEETKNADSGK